MCVVSCLQLASCSCSMRHHRANCRPLHTAYGTRCTAADPTGQISGTPHAGRRTSLRNAPPPSPLLKASASFLVDWDVLEPLPLDEDRKWYLKLYRLRGGDVPVRREDFALCRQHALPLPLPEVLVWPPPARARRPRGEGGHRGGLCGRRGGRGGARHVDGGGSAGGGLAAAGAGAAAGVASDSDTSTTSSVTGQGSGYEDQPARHVEELRALVPDALQAHGMWQSFGSELARVCIFPMLMAL